MLPLGVGRGLGLHAMGLLPIRSLATGMRGAGDWAADGAGAPAAGDDAGAVAPNTSTDCACAAAAPSAKGTAAAHKRTDAAHRIRPDLNSLPIAPLMLQTG